MNKLISKILKKSFLFALLSSASVQLYAQEVVDEKKGISFVLTGGAQVSFERGKKISEEPKFVDTVNVKIDVNYASIDKQVEHDFKVETIKPPKLLIMEPLQKLYKGLIQVGLNDFKSPPFLDFKYSAIRNKDYNAGINLRHFSSDLKLKNIAETRFTENMIDLYAKKFYKRAILSTSANYNYNTFRQYGYNPLLFPISAKDDKQYYSFLDVKASLESRKEEEKKFHYKSDFNYKQLFSRYDVQEHLLGVDLKASTYNLFKGQIDSILPQSKYLRMSYFNLSGEHLLSSDSAVIAEGTLFKASAGYKLKSKVFSVDAKLLSFAFLTNRDGIRWTPKIDIDYNIAKDIIIVYAGFNRTIERNYYMTYFSSNPFIGANLPNINTLLDYQLTAGLKGALSAKTTFNIGTHYKDYQNFVLFVNDVNSIAQRKYNVITDKVVHKQFYGELIYENKKMKIGLLGEYNIYEVFKNEAYHLPAIKAQAYVKYTVQDKFNIGADLFYYGEQLALDVVAATVPVTTIKLKPILDFNVNVEYHYSERLGAFLKVNNILSTQHQRWNQYPNYGINLLGGFSYTF